MQKDFLWLRFSAISAFEMPKQKNTDLFIPFCFLKAFRSPKLFACKAECHI